MQIFVSDCQNSLSIKILDNLRIIGDTCRLSSRIFTCTQTKAPFNLYGNIYGLFCPFAG